MAGPLACLLLAPFALHLPMALPAVRPACARAPAPRLAEDGKLPFGLGGIAKGLASALESILDAGFPGQLQLIEDGERALRSDEQAIAVQICCGLSTSRHVCNFGTKESMSFFTS